MFKKLLLGVMAAAILVSGSLAFASSAEAYTRVRGYYKPSNGAYVMPHYRTSTNSYKLDNWSTKGNVNPFTGKKGYKVW
jgi:hypothetical protein